MKELLQQYAGYNAWANLLLTDAIKQLPDETIHQEIQSSFGSIYKTVLHLLDAEFMWWQRIKLQEHIKRPSENFTGNFVELQKKLLQQSAHYKEHEQATEALKWAALTYVVAALASVAMLAQYIMIYLGRSRD